jgi:hypothetical protein
MDKINAMLNMIMINNVKLTEAHLIGHTYVSCSEAQKMSLIQGKVSAMLFGGGNMLHLVVSRNIIVVTFSKLPQNLHV